MSQPQKYDNVDFSELITRDYEAGKYEQAAVIGLKYLNGTHGQSASSIVQQTNASRIIVKSLLHLKLHKNLHNFLSGLSIEFEKKCEVYYFALKELLEAGHGEAIVSAAEESSPETVLHIFNLYFHGCHLFLTDHWHEAASHFQEFQRLIPTTLATIPFSTNPNLNVCFRQGMLVSDSTEIERRYTEHKNSTAFDDFKFILDCKEKRGPTERPIFFFSANPPYIKLMLEEFCESVLGIFPDAIIHGNIINPTDDIIVYMEKISAQLQGQLDVSSICTKYETSAAYTCGRFFAMEHILKIYQAPIYCLDMDSMVQDIFKELVSIEKNFHFSCMDTGRVEPASQFSASIMIYVPGQVTQIFLDYLITNFAENIHLNFLENWMLDQAGLYSIIHHFKAAKPELKFYDFNKHSGRSIKDYAADPSNLQEKDQQKTKTWKAELTDPALNDLKEIPTPPSL